MLTRRSFLQLSATGIATAALSRFSIAALHRVPIGLQLYTVRDQAESDLPGTLAQIKKIGYDEVETYWNVYNRPAKQLHSMIVDAGLKVPSGHFDYDGLAGKMEYAKELGVQYMVCPMLPKTMWNAADDFKKAGDQFNQWAEQVQKMGMKFAFHNHNYEFKKFGDKTGFDILMANTDPKLVGLEMDCYWITQAGLNPVTMLKKYKERIHMLHLKDRKPGFATSQQLEPSAEHFTEVGSGSIDWKAIFTVAEEQGVEHYFVERDSGDKPAMESIRISYEYLNQLLH